MHFLLICKLEKSQLFKSAGSWAEPSKPILPDEIHGRLLNHLGWLETTVRLELNGGGVRPSAH